MATIPQPPPPPPPMPGTSGAFIMPNWRDNYQSSFRESVPTKEEIEKQQYAHLPDKLLNTMNKDKKPFTYTPSGVSSEKGVLDLSEIRSPRMKKRLLANLHAGEEDEDEDETGDQQPLSQVTNQQNAQQLNGSNLVMPPIPNDTNKLPSPNYNGQQAKKEVRFAPSPIPVLACDNNELASKLASRKQDVEARSTIVTNEPIQGNGDDIEDLQQEKITTNQNNVDMNQLCKNAAEAVRTARGIADNIDTENNRGSPEINKMHDGFTELHLNELKNVQQSDSLNLNRLKTCENSQFQNFTTNNNNPNMKQINNPQSFYNSDVLKHVLDAGLQDEIDKFEEIGSKMESPSSEVYQSYPSERTVNKRPPPPIPPKPQMNFIDGRISCPPFQNYNNPISAEQDYFNNFRCISPSIEILKKTQNTGYNYVSKPRPFYRLNDENENTFKHLNQQSMKMDSYKTNIDEPIHHHNNYSNLNNERVIPIRFEDRNGYSASLPRKIKLNQDPTQPKTYEDPEFGREYLYHAGMFSQLPPKVENNSISLSPPPQNNKMFYGVNPRQISKFKSDHAKTYIDPEANREYLPNAGMFSQLPPSQSSRNNYKTYNNDIERKNDLYSFQNRQSSLPPQPMNRMTSEQQPPINLPVVNQLPKMPNKPLSLSELRKLPPSERPHEPAPSKYTGANIPSRSFRILQLITGEDVPNQFVQNQDEEREQISVRKLESQSPTPPPRNDSLRQGLQQQQWSRMKNLNNENPYETQIGYPEQMSTFNNHQTTTSTVYANSAFGTDF